MNDTIGYLIVSSFCFAGILFLFIKPFNSTDTADDITLRALAILILALFIFLPIVFGNTL